MNDQFLTELQNVMGGSGIFMEEPMKKHTTFRVGGPADVLVQPDETALAAILALCRQYHVSYSFIGNGSNLLVGDKGIRGVVIEMTDPMGNIEVDGTKITAQAGAMLSKIANTAASNGLGGMEFAAGIPGSVGGAVVMNAGAYGGEMKDIIEKVYVLDENGAQLELDRDALDLGYRHSCIPEKKYIVTKVVLELVPRNEAEIRSEMKELNEKAVLHLANAAETFLMAEEYIGRNADMMYNRYVICKKDRTIIKQGLFQEDRLMQSYVIQRAVSETAGKKKDIGMLHVKLIQELEKKQSGSRISLIYGITVWQNYGDICLIKGELEKKSEIELKMEVFPYENMQIQEKKYTKWFDYDKIKEIPCVRKRQAGDFLTVTKEGGRKKLKDYLIDCKVPRQERDSLTVLADGSHILWVVGYRISEYYKVTEKTKTVIRVHVKGESEDE